jgi:hypothetical protein
LCFHSSIMLVLVPVWMVEKVQRKEKQNEEENWIL